MKTEGVTKTNSKHMLLMVGQATNSLASWVRTTVDAIVAFRSVIAS